MKPKLCVRVILTIILILVSIHILDATNLKPVWVEYWVRESIADTSTSAKWYAPYAPIGPLSWNPVGHGPGYVATFGISCSDCTAQGFSSICDANAIQAPWVGWPQGWSASEISTKDYGICCVFPTNSAYLMYIISKNYTENFGSLGSSDSYEAENSNAEISEVWTRNISCLNSSVDLKTGNVYHSQQVGPLTFSYNSLDVYNGPLGQGWTHDFNIFITSNSNGTLYLKSGDGNRTWYKPDSSNVYRADAKSKDSSSIIQNADGTYTRTTRYGKVYNFNAAGKLTGITDRNGNTTTLTYTGNDLTQIADGASGQTITLEVVAGKIQSITQPVSGTRNQTFSIAYSSGGLPSSIQDISDPTENITWHYQYDSNNRMTQKTDPSGNNSYYYYNADGTLNYSTDPNGISKYIAYNSANSTTTVTEKDGGVWTHKYYAEFNVPLEITDPLGNKTSYSYDNNNHLLSIAYPDSTTESYTYDSATGNLTSHVDRRGNTTTLVYDPDPQKGGGGKRITEIQDAASKTVHLTYDENGNLKTYTDRTGATTTFYREDAKKNITRIVDPLNHSFLYDYHGGGGILGNKVMQMTDPNGHTTTLTRNKVGNVLTSTDALDHITSFGYEADGERLSTITDHLNHTILFGYDANGDVNSVTDPVGNPPTKYEYNYRGQLTKITDSNNNSTYLYYATAGCSTCGAGGEMLSSLTDPLQSTTTFSYGYDTTNKLYVTNRTDPLQKTTTSTYDVRTRQQVVKDRNQNQLTYTYTPTGKLGSIAYPGGATTSYTYDIRDRLQQVQDSNGLARYEYDDEGSATYYQDANGYTLQFLYYPGGNLQRITYPDSTTLTYCYDNVNRLERVLAGSDQDCANTGQAGQAIYAYHDNGLLQNYTGFNEITTNYSYDDANRLTGITSPVASWGFTLDDAGRRTASTETVPLSAVPELGTVSYTYNTPGKNRLLTAGSTAYGYDDEGQLQTAGGATLTFDCDHQLTEISDTNGVDQFFYDARGFRIKAIRGGVETRYIYDPWGNLLAEADASNQITRKYIYGKGLIAVVTPSSRYCYHFDATGHTIALTDMAGTVVNSYAYEPFGEILAEQETIAQPFKYVGQYGVMAEPSGLYYMRARYYDPSVGRFISEDPIGFAGGDVNLYAYVRGNPTNLIDPNGKNPLLIIALAGFFLLKHSDVANAPTSPADPLQDSIGAHEMFADGMAMIGALSGQGRGSGKIGPCPTAQGPHSVFKGNQGRITNYRTYEPNPYDPGKWIEKFGYDSAGKSHYNKANGQDVPTPHVHDPSTPGGVRPPQPSEIP